MALKFKGVIWNLIHCPPIVGGQVIDDKRLNWQWFIFQVLNFPGILGQKQLNYFAF